MKFKICTLILTAIMLSLFIGMIPATSFEESGTTDKSKVVQKVPGGEIDWGANAYYATGEGLVPSEKDESNRVKAGLKASTYARMKAIANLLMVIEGTTISYQSSGRDLRAADETIRQTIDGFVRNVQIVGEEKREEAGETIVTVTVRAPFYGPMGPGSVLLKKGAEIDRSQPSPVKIEGKQTRPNDLPSRGSGPYTSLVIDTRGLNVQRAMSPKIRRPGGSEVWGTIKVDHDFLQERGIVGYALKIDELKKNPRTGDSPLFIQAIQRAGGAFMCDAVISNADAEFILAENAKTRFLDKCNIIFLVDPQQEKKD